MRLFCLFHAGACACLNGLPMIHPQLPPFGGPAITILLFSSENGQADTRWSRFFLCVCVCV